MKPSRNQAWAFFFFFFFVFKLSSRQKTCTAFYSNIHRGCQRKKLIPLQSQKYFSDCKFWVEPDWYLIVGDDANEQKNVKRNIDIFQHLLENFFVCTSSSWYVDGLKILQYPWALATVAVEKKPAGWNQSGQIHKALMWQSGTNRCTVAA